MKTFLFLTLTGLVAACTPDPAACTEKHDYAVCQKLCETGKQDFQALCFMERAQKIVACADKGTDCANACKEWRWDKTDPTRDYFLADVGDNAKVEAIEKACAPFKPAAP